MSICQCVCVRVNIDVCVRVNMSTLRGSYVHIFGERTCGLLTMKMCLTKNSALSSRLIYAHRVCSCHLCTRVLILFMLILSMLTRTSWLCSTSALVMHSCAHLVYAHTHILSMLNEYALVMHSFAHLVYAHLYSHLISACHIRQLVHNMFDNEFVF